MNSLACHIPQRRSSGSARQRDERRPCPRMTLGAPGGGGRKKVLGTRESFARKRRGPYDRASRAKHRVRRRVCREDRQHVAVRGESAGTRPPERADTNYERFFSAPSNRSAAFRLLCFPLVIVFSLQASTGTTMGGASSKAARQLPKTAAATKPSWAGARTPGFGEQPQQQLRPTPQGLDASSDAVEASETRTEGANTSRSPLESYCSFIRLLGLKPLNETRGTHTSSRSSNNWDLSR